MAKNGRGRQAALNPMTADPVVTETVKEIVKTHQQPDAVSTQLILWYEQVLSGNESLDADKVANKHTAFNHLDRILEQMWSPADQEPTFEE